MAERWWAVYRQDTGELLSVGSSDESLTPEQNGARVITPARAAEKGYALLPLPGRPDDGVMWDEATRSFVPRPLKDPVRTFLSDPAIGALAPQTRALIESKLDEHFGLRRRSDA